LSRGEFLKNEALDEYIFPEENRILELVNLLVELILFLTSSDKEEGLSS
jgi:hypothetical protein